MGQKRRWTAEEKLLILKESETEGVTPTIRKHGLYAKTLYEWKDKYQSDGLAGLQSVYRRVDPELKQLQKENQRLKELLAEKELALRIKDELLKKTNRRKPSA